MTHQNSKSAAAPVDYASIARIASAVELRDIALRSSSANLNVATVDIPGDWSGQAFVGFDTTLGDYRPDSREFTIDAAFIAVFKPGWANETRAEMPVIEPDDPPDIEIQANFELTYVATTDAELDDADLANFAVSNGTLHAWPYWREFAGDITRRMQIPGLVVGVFKLPSRHDPGGRPEASNPEDAEGTDAVAEEVAIPSDIDADPQQGGEAT